MSKPLVILGTARSEGETRRAIDISFPKGTVDLIDLNHWRVAPYDYGYHHSDDDFLSVIDATLSARAIIFATPVYWYSMSGQLKIFFDRLTDLLDVAKEKGWALAGKSVGVLASGFEDDLPEGFEVPFRRTSDYFGMHYCGPCISARVAVGDLGKVSKKTSFDLASECSRSEC